MCKVALISTAELNPFLIIDSHRCGSWFPELEIYHCLNWYGSDHGTPLGYLGSLSILGPNRGIFSKLIGPGPLGSGGISHTSFSNGRFRALETSFHIDVFTNVWSNTIFLKCLNLVILGDQWVGLTVGGYWKYGGISTPAYSIKKTAYGLIAQSAASRTSLD